MKDFLPHSQEFLLNLTNNNYSNETIKNYKRDLLIFAYFLEFSRTRFKKINKTVLTMYKGFLKDGKSSEIFTNRDNSAVETIENRILSHEGSRTHRFDVGRLSGRSINRMLSSIRAYLRFLIEFDYPTPIPPDAIKLIKTERKESQVAEFEDLVRLVEFPTLYEKKKIVAKRNRAMLELLFSTGMRISEIVKLNLEDIDVGQELQIRQGKLYIMGKGKKQRFVYLTERCKLYLQEYLKSRNDMYPALFTPTRGTRKSSVDVNGIRVSSRYIQNRIALYRRLLGIIVPTTPHSLRHGFATYLAEKGANPAAIQRLLGHESLQTTTRYVHASDRFAQETHKKYHPLQNDTNKTPVEHDLSSLKKIDRGS